MKTLHKLLSVKCKVKNKEEERLFLDHIKLFQSTYGIEVKIITETDLCEGCYNAHT